jgi:hypothetical protein
LQQSWLPAVQAPPVAEHGSHLPAMQRLPEPAQQSLSTVQAPPVAEHGSHLPAMQRLPEPAQHSVAVVQLWPVCAQQAPPVQALPLQQVAAVVQPPPSAVHGAQVPLLQMLEQQSVALTQVALSAAQLPQTPL